MNMHHKKTARQNSSLGETLNNNVMKYNNITEQCQTLKNSVLQELQLPVT